MPATSPSRTSLSNFNNSFAYSKTLFEYLSPHIAHGAAHNSDERWNAPACHEETRVAIREDILSWIKHGEGDEEPKKIMWLSGPAGSGKTAIAGSVAETCKGGGLLAATFFFSSFAGSAERSSKRGLIATLAYHMSQVDALHQFKAHLHAAVDRHPDIFRKNLKEQADCLILQPFQNIGDPGNRAGWPKIVIIDGLDEVVAALPHAPEDQQIPGTAEEDQIEILRVLLTLSQSPSFPFLIFVASRPEANITDFFATDAQDATVELFLDSKYNPDADVERFLVSKFAHIRRRAGISSSLWPGQPALDRLVEMSSGQFIVPTTIIRWVEAGVPQLQLAEVLQLDPLNTRANPFATLDVLYHHIIKRAHNTQDDPHLVVKWILCIASAHRPFMFGDPPSADFCRQFFENVEGELNFRLAPITSLISVPPRNNTSSCITIYHKSLTDFLSSPSRCGGLYVNGTAYDSFFAEIILAVLKNKGPTVPCSAPADLVRFIEAFFRLDVLMEESPEILAPLSERSKAELAACDVAWWTTSSLSELYSDGSGLPHSDNINSTGPSREKLGSHDWLVRGIYARIHQAMGCDSNPPSPTQRAMQQAPGSKCHAACIRWRTGILARAKELGWCVHRLEELELDKLVDVSIGESRSMFHPRSPECSTVCRPPPTTI